METLEWFGPYCFDGDTNVVFDVQQSRSVGVYLWTFPHKGGHLVHYVGETGMSFRKRLAQEVLASLSGDARIWDLPALAQGDEKLIWELDAKKDHFISDLLKRHQEIASLARGYLAQLRVF